MSCVLWWLLKSQKHFSSFVFVWFVDIVLDNLCILLWTCRQDCMFAHDAAIQEVLYSGWSCSPLVKHLGVLSVCALRMAQTCLFCWCCCRASSLSASTKFLNQALQIPFLLQFHGWSPQFSLLCGSLFPLLVVSLGLLVSSAVSLPQSQFCFGWCSKKRSSKLHWPCLLQKVICPDNFGVWIASTPSFVCGSMMLDFFLDCDGASTCNWKDSQPSDIRKTLFTLLHCSVFGRLCDSGSQSLARVSSLFIVTLCLNNADWSDSCIKGANSHFTRQWGSCVF